MTALTQRQQEVLKFMLDYQRANGMPPTIREISAFLGTKYINGAVGHLARLEKKGVVRKRKLGSGTYSSRGWQAIDNTESEAVRLLREGERLVDQLECLALPEYPSMYEESKQWRLKVIRLLNQIGPRLGGILIMTVEPKESVNGQAAGKLEQPTT